MNTQRKPLMSSTTTSTEERALELLGTGLGAEVVASAVGVSTSRISQLLSDPEFASRVAELRFENLAKHNQRDSKYDSLEDELLKRMENLLPMMYKPLEVLRAIAVINSAKRRGSSAPDSLVNQTQVVSLTMPITIHQQFTTNINNQVVKAGDQELITMQSGKMNSLSTLLANSRKVAQDVLPSPDQIINQSQSSS